MRTLRNLLRESSLTQWLGTGIRFWMNNEHFISFSFRFIERRNFLSQRRARILKAPGRTAHYVRLMYAYRYIWYAFRLCCRSGSVRTTGRDNMYERFSERCAPESGYHFESSTVYRCRAADSSPALNSTQLSFTKFGAIVSAFCLAQAESYAFSHEQRRQNSRSAAIAPRRALRRHA